jgi:cyclophilin family peptidyl-prolyl cis-trans isomerase
VSAEEAIAPAVTHTVYMDIQISEKPIQRLEIDLFGKEMPNVVGNFVELCRNNAYAGSSFYRVLSAFSIQGGAIENSPTTTVDNYSIKHTQRGLISTGLPNSADSRFFVQCTDDAGWADDRYAAFGKVTDATFNVVKEIEKVPVQPPKNAPKSPIRIVASGLVREY